MEDFIGYTIADVADEFRLDPENHPADVLRSRPTLGRVLFDLYRHLPNNLARYLHDRIAGSPRCFWYSRLYSSTGKLHGFSFVVCDTDPVALEVIWVLHAV